MNFIFTVEVEVNRTEGKFATRDEIAEQIQEALENADPGQYEGENEGQYETSNWSVTEEPEAPTPKKKKKAVVQAPAPESEAA